MTKQDWLDVFNTTTTKDLSDWLLIAASILSPIVALVTTIYAAKSAKAAEKATNLNLKMYSEQKEEQAKIFLPLFDVSSYLDEYRTYAVVNLANKNNYQITGLKIKITDPLVADAEWSGPDPSDDTVHITLNQNFNDVSYYAIEVEYNTVNQRRYSTRIEFHEHNRDYVTSEIIGHTEL